MTIINGVHDNTLNSFSHVDLKDVNQSFSSIQEVATTLSLSLEDVYFPDSFSKPVQSSVCTKKQ